MVTSTPPQETPVIVNMARPRRLQSTFVEGNSMSAPYRPLVRVQVPMSATVTAESISAIPQVTGTAIPLQRPIAVTMPQTTQLQTIQSHRCSHEVRIREINAILGGTCSGEYDDLVLNSIDD